MKKVIYSLIAGLSLVGSSAVAGHNPPPPQNAEVIVVVAGPGVDRLKHMVEKLDLTPQQKEKIQGILASTDAKLKKGLDQVRTNNKQLHELTGPSYNASKVASLADAQGKLCADAIKTRLEARHEIYALLTPEQQKKLEQFKEEKKRGVL